MILRQLPRLTEWAVEQARRADATEAENTRLRAERDRLNVFVSWLTGVMVDNSWCMECGAWQEVEDAIDRLLIDLATSAPIEGEGEKDGN